MTLEEVKINVELLLPTLEKLKQDLHQVYLGIFEGNDEHPKSKWGYIPDYVDNAHSYLTDVIDNLVAVSDEIDFDEDDDFD